MFEELGTCSKVTRIAATVHDGPHYECSSCVNWRPVSGSKESTTDDPFLTVTDHKFISEVCHSSGCQYLVLTAEKNVSKESTEEAKVAQHLEKVAQSIRALEGLPVDFRLAKKLTETLRLIEEICPHSS